MPAVQPRADVESGVLTQELLFGEWNFDERKLVTVSNYIAGALVILFLAGVLPLSLLFLTSVLLVCLSTCIRAHVEHRLNAHEREFRGLNSLSDVLQVLSEAGQSHNSADASSLQLSLLRREFNERDYDTLLALDLEVTRRKQEQISDDHLKVLTTYRQKRKEDLASHGVCSDSVCCVCLEGVEEGACVTQLPCQHHFHSECIHPWLRQQGLTAACPLCKAEVWPKTAKLEKAHSSNFQGAELADMV